MKSIVAFFEIPAINFDRAVNFYQEILGIRLKTMECEDEKMGFFPEEDGSCPGAISWSATFEFKPSDQGVLISLNCSDMESKMDAIQRRGGKILIPKTKVEAEGIGYFSVFLDSEGNRIGLYAVS